jgi:ABC-type Fe3+ transport system permease subunit
MKRSAAAGLVVLMALFTLMPVLAWASGGGGATEIVVVADTRVVHNPVFKYFANIYNTNILEFAVWCVVLTAVYGMILGFLMDWIMSKTGLDLRSRKIVEH